MTAGEEADEVEFRVLLSPCCDDGSAFCGMSRRWPRRLSAVDRRRKHFMAGSRESRFPCAFCNLVQIAQALIPMRDPTGKCADISRARRTSRASTGIAFAELHSAGRRNALGPSFCSVRDFINSCFHAPARTSGFKSASPAFPTLASVLAGSRARRPWPYAAGAGGAPGGRTEDSGKQHATGQTDVPWHGRWKTQRRGKTVAERLRETPLRRVCGIGGCSESTGVRAGLTAAPVVA